MEEQGRIELRPPTSFKRSRAMFDIDAFVIRGHEKVIDHYRRLRDSSTSETERQEFQRRIDEVGKALRLHFEGRSPGGKRAA